MQKWYDMVKFNFSLSVFSHVINDENLRFEASSLTGHTHNGQTTSDTGAYVVFHPRNRFIYGFSATFVSAET